MTITVLDTATEMNAVLTADEPARPDLVRVLLSPMEGMFRYLPGDVDLFAMHTMSMGFPIDRCVDETRRALGRLVAADAWNRIERALVDAVAVQTLATPDLQVPDISFLLVLGDPDDDYFMSSARGLSGNGSATGYISLTLWPTDENLARLEASAVHELNHNLRYAPGGVVWDPTSVVVGEHIVSEGLADAFARQLYGDSLGYTPFGVPHLDDDAAFEKIVSALNVSGMENFAAWVIGDDAAARFGAEPVGVPMGAGYAVGNRLVDRYLIETGKRAADALHVPSAEIIKGALGSRR
ncbi:DUF2268 domain-containing protein [Rhodococcus artemisiae]|uniref:DUF2268 domain-containing putative Zn-dependent protease n=1 Tax=Rhodococcus artemisiae TaxID=714159 RepID=A0ABU7L6Z7_9NOCA|nr:DUF2268 domain-containing putative Zn-dependent protease [Rhodococcus artemisiae]MEE2057326.1 DUF2268 domain-containing putative Zn-dependent protease [Rhodococcus artemisiae]